MADFSYLALDKDGKRVKGSLKAISEEEVRVSLRKENLKVISIKQKGLLTKDIQFSFSKKVKPKDLSVFCRQFSSVLMAGVTIVDGLKMLADQTENKSLKRAIVETREAIQQGETFAGAMKKNRKIFGDMFINMVEAGEESGSIEVSIDRMGRQFEKSAKLAGLIKGAMIYPIAVLVTSLAVMVGMSVFIIPKFATMFVSIGSELPFTTRTVMAFSDLLINRWWLVIMVVAGTILFVSWFATTKPGKELFGRIALKAPIFGDLNIKNNAARFSRTMATLVSSGMSITAAVEITGKALTNVWYKYALEKAKSAIESGQPLSEPIKNASDIFPPMVHNMIAIGEETGNLEHMLDKAAEYFEEETELKTKTLTELMQPMIMVLLGGIIGFLVLAMYQPMIGVYNIAGQY